MRRHAIAVIAVLLVSAPALAGCIEPPSEHPPAGDYSIAPPVSTHAAVSIKDMETEIRAWRHGDADLGETLWQSTGGEWRDQTFTLPMTYTGEHGDVAFTLTFRLDGSPPVHLIHDETLARRHSFNFTYAARPVDGPPVDHVARVDANASWVDAETWERSRNDVSGRFYLAFDAACAECPDGETVPVVIEGRFPKPKR